MLIYQIKKMNFSEKHIISNQKQRRNDLDKQITDLEQMRQDFTL